MNLHDLYARVCAVRPELAVSMLYYEVDVWRHVGLAVSPQHAAALILARWVEALPAWFKLSKQDNSDDERAINGVLWWVEDSIHGRREAYEKTPIEALAAFYLEETT